MALNVQVATILQQACIRLSSVESCSIMASPDTDDHTERKVVYSIKPKGADEPVEGVLEVNQNVLQSKAATVLNGMVEGLVPENVNDDAKRLLDNQINRLLEM